MKMIERNANQKTMKNKLKHLESKMMKKMMALQVSILSYLNSKMVTKMKRKNQYLSDSRDNTDSKSINSY
jgi:hypothetical protein